MFRRAFGRVGKKEGGWGEGIFAREPKRSPAAPRFERGNLQNQWAALCGASELIAQKSESLILEPMMRIELMTSFLPRKRSATELHRLLLTFLFYLICLILQHLIYYIIYE